ncbi:MAG: hypothetical protein ABEH47_01115 [Haloferacaceae archaeon]
MTTDDAGGVLPVDGIPPGGQLLVLSPPLLGARTLGYRFVAAGLDDGEAAVVVSTDRSADRVADAVGEYASSTDALVRLGIVDCSGHASDAPCAVAPVGSPADLTGIGIGVSQLLDRFEGYDRLRLVLDSVSTLLVYNDFERVFRFVHALAGRVESRGARSLLLLQSDTDRQAVDSLQGLTDGRVDLREHDGRTEYRLRGLDDAAGEWRPLDVGGPTPDVGAGEPEPVLDEEPVTSLHDLIERMAAKRLTLTVCNYTGDDETLGELRDYFDRLNVSTRTVALPTETPTDLAVLHRDAETLATADVSTLRDWVRTDGLADAPDRTTERAVDLARPEVVARATRDEYSVANAGKLRMVRISRLLELRALGTGGGELHTGFQRVDRIDDELGTRRLYERVAAAGVDVHLYGLPGDVPNRDAYTVHAGEDDELADTWFVVYDGGPDPSRAGALVTEETEPDHYSGFWTYRPGVARATLDYLDATY